MGKGSTRTTGPYASKALLNRSPLISTGTPVTYAAQAGCGSRGRAGGGCSAPPQRPMSGHRTAPASGAAAAARARSPAAGRAARLVEKGARRRSGPAAALPRSTAARPAARRSAARPAARRSRRRPRRRRGPSRARAWRRPAARRSARPFNPAATRAARQNAPLERPKSTAPGVRAGARPHRGGSRAAPGPPRARRHEKSQPVPDHCDAVDWALSLRPTCRQKARRSDPSARIRARRRVRAVSLLGKPGAQTQRRSPLCFRRARRHPLPFRRCAPRPGCPALTRLNAKSL